jgi:hypothetical protein
MPEGNETPVKIIFNSEIDINEFFTPEYENRVEKVELENIASNLNVMCLDKPKVTEHLMKKIIDLYKKKFNNSEEIKKIIRSIEKCKSIFETVEKETETSNRSTQVRKTVKSIEGKTNNSPTTSTKVRSIVKKLSTPTSKWEKLAQKVRDKDSQYEALKTEQLSILNEAKRQKLEDEIKYITTIQQLMKTQNEERMNMFEMNAGQFERNRKILEANLIKEATRQDNSRKIVSKTINGGAGDEEFRGFGDVDSRLKLPSPGEFSIELGKETYITDINDDKHMSTYKEVLCEIEWGIQYLTNSGGEVKEKRIEKTRFSELINQASVRIVEDFTTDRLFDLRVKNPMSKLDIHTRDGSFEYVVKLELGYDKSPANVKELIDFLMLHQNELLILFNDGITPTFSYCSSSKKTPEIKGYLGSFTPGKIIMTGDQYFRTDSQNTLSNEKESSIQIREYKEGGNLPREFDGDIHIVRSSIERFNPFDLDQPNSFIIIEKEEDKKNMYVITLFGAHIDKQIKEALKQIAANEKQILDNIRDTMTKEAQLFDMTLAREQQDISNLARRALSNFNNASYVLLTEKKMFEAHIAQERNFAENAARQEQNKQKAQYNKEMLEFEAKQQEINDAILQKTQTEELETFRTQMDELNKLHQESLNQLKQNTSLQTQFTIREQRIIAEKNEQFKTKEAILLHIANLIQEFKSLTGREKEKYQAKIDQLISLKDTIERKFTEADTELIRLQGEIQQSIENIRSDVMGMTTSTISTVDHVSRLKTHMQTTTENYSELITSSKDYLDKVKKKLVDSKSIYDTLLNKAPKETDMALGNIPALTAFTNLSNNIIENGVAQNVSETAASRGGARKGKSMKHTKKSSKKTKKRTASSKKTKRKKSKSTTKSTKHTKRKK